MAQEVASKNLHRVVGACIIYRRRLRIPEYLILKRRDDAKVYPGLWTVPGGGMDRDDYEPLPQTSPDGWENPLQLATRREITEEAGVEVGEFEFLNDFAFIRPDNVPVFGVRFAAPYVSGEVRLDPKDSTEYAWITADQVPEYELLGDIPAEIARLDARLFHRV